jgi:hypothetical protein
LTVYRATELALNEYGLYECYFCPGLDFPYIQQLNQHLESPKHSKRSDTGLYTCPRCQHYSQTLSGLIQHAEMGKCGIRKDPKVKNAMDSLTSNMRLLAF